MMSAANSLRTAPHIEPVKSPISSHSSLKHQMPQHSERVRSMSEKSAEQSQGSHPSQASIPLTARSPKHPDLASAFRQNASLSVSPGYTEQQNTSGLFGNRLSTIPDVDDVQEMDGDSSEQHAVEGDQDQPDPAGWDFLYLVQEHQKQRQGPGQDGTFLLPPPFEALTEQKADYSRPHDFPPSANIFPTPLSDSKPLPALPKSPSVASRIIRGIPLDEDFGTSNDDEMADPPEIDDWRPIVIQTPLMSRSPALPPLPPSESGRTPPMSQTDSNPPQITPNSSARTARGSAGPPPFETLDPDVPTPVPRGRRSRAGTRSRASWVGSDGEELVAELTNLAEATCSKCGRVFSSRNTLQKHLDNQGGICYQRSLEEELDIVGDDEDE
ncbi:uncharacterized protein EI90DRAFT_3042815 [Cantharellus anzutake]|uniref:uncharacterized protein n=1 Tax=Cantharellus anzutake TaxID=1750568 RepID=UPI0019064E9F|nr:uncharacterized protein EI90DRAFT_3042815 [Cantharellus anzutake]KAF8337390.1 hypothetical protein EI90DRAFT_3042815 [Cantharellus anzutake]